jgi:hypothetical protein
MAIRMTVVVDKGTVVLLERIQAEVGLTKSESVRRAVGKYGVWLGEMGMLGKAAEVGDE